MDGKQVGALTSVGAIALSGGVALGYFLGLRKGKKTEIVVVKPKEYVVTRKTRAEREAHSLMVKEHMDAMHAEEGDTESETIEQAVPEDRVIRVFAAPESEWDYEVELSTRESKEIYTIHRDEFFGEEMGYRQSTVTFYRGDDVVCDELEKPIYNYPNLLGDTLLFGHGSNDPNVVYIRNDRERMEWEVLLDNGRYEIEVLGLEIDHEYEEKDLKHSVRRFVMD